MAGRDVLTDEQWARIELLLPPEKGPMGRPQKLHRPIVDGIVHRYRAGLAWRDLPERYGPWQTVCNRHHTWSADGTWEAVLAVLLADADAADTFRDEAPVVVHRRAPAGARRGLEPHDNGALGRRDEPGDHPLGRSRGGLGTTVHLLVDNAGRPLVVMVSPGQAGDSPALPPMRAELRVARRGAGRPRTRCDQSSSLSQRSSR